MIHGDPHAALSLHEALQHMMCTKPFCSIGSATDLHIEVTYVRRE